MNRPCHSLGMGCFAHISRDDLDPWGFETSEYERAKYKATLAALPRVRYARALEVGCAGGVLTRQLALRCDELLAVDLVDAVLDRARERCRDRPNVGFEQLELPGERPAGRFDLILLSEVGYYWNGEDLGRFIDCARAAVTPGGTFGLVHWIRGTDYPLTGDEVHDRIIVGLAEAFATAASTRTENYRLDMLRRFSECDGAGGIA